MPPSSQTPKLLIANRGEISIRIASAAAALGIKAVAVYSEDDAQSPHVGAADEAVALEALGPAAYLDMDRIVAVAEASGCTLIHPGYGFLAERADFARRAAERGLVFVGPTPETLELLGDKARARALAASLGVSVLEGTEGPSELGDIVRFFRELGRGGAVVIKAVAGGGGRGMRVVTTEEEIAPAYERCQSEARSAFGSEAVYAERFVPEARHVEVQVIGDGSGSVTHLHARECSAQRRHQKVLEIAPPPRLPDAVRGALHAAALAMANAADYRSLGTFEFLVDASIDPAADDGASLAVSGVRDLAATRAARLPRHWFIEANPRLQVEHTVTEAVLGIDLVQAQIRVALGASLADVGIIAESPPKPWGYAIQARVNMETFSETGEARPAVGTITEFEVPTGPGVRVDTYGTRGFSPSPRFDSLLAKVIVHGSGQLADVARLADRALSRFVVGGVSTNIGLLRSLLSRRELVEGRVTTRFIEQHASELLAGAPAMQVPTRDPGTADANADSGRAGKAPLAGANLKTGDPLAVLQYGKAEAAAARAVPEEALPDGTVGVRAPLQGSVVSLDVDPGQEVARGQGLLVMEAMKMQHVVHAPTGGVVTDVRVSPADTVYEGHLLVTLEVAEGAGAAADDAESVDLDAIRPDLEETFKRHAYGHDASRPEAVEKRRKLGRRTVRENVDDLVDAGTFVEYGPLVIAAQRQRRSEQELMERTPGDGMVAGVGSVNGDRFSEDRCQCAVVAYDYTVLAGTQGIMNHHKKDRMFQMAREARLPVVLFAEGGGGRPGDTDYPMVGGLDTMAWTLFGKLSGLVPLVGITTGYCFAGNAVLLGQCDVVIATEGSNIGLGGPAMVEGGGLGVFRPEEIGPLDVQTKNGVVDVAVRDEAEAVRVAKKYLAFFQGDLADGACADQRRLRALIPENRVRVYDVHRVIDALFDTDSVLELRRDFGRNMVVAFGRVEGKTVGVIANNPLYLAGAIDSDAADKAARFMQLCDAFDVPLLFLCDTPGIMVGPEAEKTATARHATRLFNIAANLTIPFFTIVLRKGYGLGAMAMAGGSFKAPLFTVGWPTAEFGGMGLEGAVKLGARKALEAIEDPAERQKMFEGLVAMMYDKGRSVNAATHFEFDDVIDPADSRKWILSVLRAAPPPKVRTEKKRPFVDTW